MRSKVGRVQPMKDKDPTQGYTNKGVNPASIRRDCHTSEGKIYNTTSIIQTGH